MNSPFFSPEITALTLLDEVARAVEFFAGPLGDFVSGQALRIDGGAYS